MSSVSSSEIDFSQPIVTNCGTVCESPSFYAALSGKSFSCVGCILLADAKKNYPGKQTAPGRCQVS